MDQHVETQRFLSFNDVFDFPAHRLQIMQAAGFAAPESGARLADGRRLRERPDRSGRKQWQPEARMLPRPAHGKSVRAPGVGAGQASHVAPHIGILYPCRLGPAPLRVTRGPEFGCYRLPALVHAARERRYFMQLLHPKCEPAA